MPSRRWLPGWLRNRGQVLWLVALLAIIASLAGNIDLRNQVHQANVRNKHFVAAVYKDCLDNHNVWQQRVASRAAAITEEQWQIRNLNSDIATINGVISYSRAQRQTFSNANAAVAANYTTLITTYDKQALVKRQTIAHQEQRLATLRRTQVSDMQHEPDCQKLRLQTVKGTSG